MMHLEFLDIMMGRSVDLDYVKVTLSVVGRDLLGSGHVLIIELSVLCASHVSLQSHITQSEYIYYTNL